MQELRLQRQQYKLAKPVDAAKNVLILVIGVTVALIFIFFSVEMP
jgi:hypothetical protein